MDKLTLKQERFCEEYVIDMNGTQAAIRAGYSENTANEQASRLLTNVNIQTKVSELRDGIQERTNITADNVVKELAKIGFMTIDELFEEDGCFKKVAKLSDKAKASVSSVKITERTYGKDDRETTEKTTEMKLWDKGKALVELGKHLGIFKEDNEQKLIPEVKVTLQPIKRV